MLAYDSNALDNQYLQGWLMHDRFLLRSALGAPYEFLWANPYHPGLSYYNLPLSFHDEMSGKLFVRSSWDDDAKWLGYFGGQLQLFENGQPRVVAPDSLRNPVQIGKTVVAAARSPFRFKTAGEVENIFVIGLEPLATYDVEADDEEMREAKTDRGGILELNFPAGFRGGVRFKKTGGAPPSSAQ